MPALNFLNRLAPAVEDGTKRHTVRRMAKRPIKPGDKLCLFTGMRTKQCRRLMDTVCTDVQNIRITAGYGCWIDGNPLTGVEADTFARNDGLAEFDELADWIGKNYGLPFDGVVIHWAYNND